MASEKRKRLSAWEILARLGYRDADQDKIILHVFDAVSRMTLRADDGEPLSGDDYLVGVFEGLGSSADWPAVGGREWHRLRFQALTKVVRRLGREGLYDCISVGADGTPALTGNATDGEHDGSGSDTTETPDGNGGGKSSTADNDGLDSDEDTQTAKNDDADPRVGVQAYRAMIRRGNMNPTGWLRMVNRATPYRVIAGWASENCPSVSRKKLTALLDDLNAVRYWNDDGHLRGAEILLAMESELEEGCGHEQWMCVVSDFEDAIRRLRGVFEKLSLL